MRLAAPLHHFASAKRQRVGTTWSTFSDHFASVPLCARVEHVSAPSSSFSRRINFSSFPTASTKSNSLAFSDSPGSAFASHAGAGVGPPGCSTAPTAVEREMLFGRTRKDVEPGMMRRPYRSPSESKMWFCASAACRCAHCQSEACVSVVSPVQKRQTTDASRSSTKAPGVRSENYKKGETST